MCKSVKSAETRSLDLGMDESIYISRTLPEIYTGSTGGHIPIHMKIDSKTLMDSINSTKQVDEKTIRHIVAWIKEQRENKLVDSIDWISNDEMLADIFTKKNVKSDHSLRVVT